MIRRPPRSKRTDTLFPYATLFRSIRREKGHEAAIVAAVETIGKGVTKFGTSPFNLHASEVIHKASRYKRDAMSCTRKFTLMARSGPSISFPIRNYGYYIIDKSKEIYWASAIFYLGQAGRPPKGERSRLTSSVRAVNQKQSPALD